MGISQPGSLDGELRLLKSEMRKVSIALSWERWIGLKNLAASANIAFTFSSGTEFTVNDNFVGASRLVAVLGRRVRALLLGSTVYGTITAASFSSPNTTITVSWDSGSMDGSLSEVQFGPEGRAVGMIQNVRVSPTAPTAGQIWRFDGTQMAPASEVGIQVLTNRTGGSLAVGDVVTISTANDNSVVLADALATKKQLVVCLDAVANLATARFANAGIVVVNVANATTAGHYLVKSATTLLAADSAIAQGDTVGIPQGAFAIALTSTLGAGVVFALLIGQTSSIQFGVTPSTQAFGDGADEGTDEAPARGDHKHAMPAGVRVYDRAATLGTIVNEAAKSTLYAVNVGAGDLGTTKALHIRIGGDYFNNSGGVRTITLTIDFGTTTMFADVTASIPAAATRRAFLLDLIIANQNSAAVQVLSGMFRVSDEAAPASGIGNLAPADLVNGTFSGGATEDTTGAKTATVSITHSTAALTLDIRRQYAYAELI
jgi:hypothetical protein